MWEYRYYSNNGYTKYSVNYKLLDNNYDGINIVYTNSNDWYHMLCIIDNIIYDIDKLKDLTVINVYRNK